MPADAWFVMGSGMLATVAFMIWRARRQDKMAAGYQQQIGASRDLHGRSEAILDRQEELQRGAMAVLDRQEEMLRRAELLMERLERIRNSADSSQARSGAKPGA
jgi:hypothetical protein